MCSASASSHAAAISLSEASSSSSTLFSVDFSAVPHLDYDHKQNLVPYLVEDAVGPNPDSIKFPPLAFQGFDSGGAGIIFEGIYFLPYAFPDSIRKGEKLFPGGGKDFNGV